MIQQRLAGVAKQYRKYFRFRARNHFSIFHPFSEKHREKKREKLSESAEYVVNNVK